MQPEEIGTLDFGDLSKVTSFLKSACKTIMGVFRIVQIMAHALTRADASLITMELTVKQVCKRGFIKEERRELTRQ